MTSIQAADRARASRFGGARLTVEKIAVAVGGAATCLATNYGMAMLLMFVFPHYFGSIGVYLCLMHFLMTVVWLGTVFLEPALYVRLRWRLILLMFAQGPLAAACIFFTEQLQGVDYAVDIVPGIDGGETFARMRAELPVFQRILYTPAWCMIEWGFGMLALYVHSLVLGALPTGALYLLTRKYRYWHPSYDVLVRGPADEGSVGDLSADETELKSVSRENKKRVLLISAGFLTSVLVVAYTAMLHDHILGTLRDHGAQLAASRADGAMFPGSVLWPVSLVLPLLWFVLRYVRTDKLLARQWLLGWVCLAQWSFFRVCGYFVDRFGGIGEDRFSEFENARLSFYPIERIWYGPVLNLVERGYGLPALILHSLVLAAIVTGMLYAFTRIYRMWRRPPAAGETELVLPGCDN